MRVLTKLYYFLALCPLVCILIGCQGGRPTVTDLRVQRITAELRPLSESSGHTSGSLYFSSEYRFMLESDAGVPITIPLAFSSDCFDREKLKVSFSDLEVAVNGSRVPNADLSKASSRGKYLAVPLSSTNTRAGAYSVLIRFKVLGAGREVPNGETLYFPITGADFSVPVDQFEIRFVAPEGVKVPPENVAVNITDGDKKIEARYHGQQTHSGNTITVRGDAVPTQMEIAFRALW